MWFFASLYRSLFDLHWLKEQKDKISSAWEYFFLFIFFLSGLLVIPIFVQMPSGLKELRSWTANNLPDFNAQWKGGELTITNLPQPYIFKNNGFVAVVDTVSTSNLQLRDWLDKENYSGLLVTKTKIELYDSTRGEGRTQSWKDFPDYLISKNDLLDKIDRWSMPMMVYLFGIIVFLVLFLGLIISKLFILLVISVLILVISNLAKKNWKFKQIFSVGLFALTLPSVLVVTLGWMGGRISFLYSLMMLVMMLLVVFTKEVKKV